MLLWILVKLTNKNDMKSSIFSISIPMNALFLGFPIETQNIYAQSKLKDTIKDRGKIFGCHYLASFTMAFLPYGMCIFSKNEIFCHRWSIILMVCFFSKENLLGSPHIPYNIQMEGG